MMSKFKKIILSFLLISIVFAAEAAAAEKINFWTISLSPKYDQYFESKFAEFEAENPGFEIIWEDLNFSSINQKLRFKIAENNPPEVVNLSPQLMASLLAEKKLFPISKLAADYSSDYYPLLWQNGFYEGQIYAFPWYLSSKLTVYNQEIFKIAELKPELVFKNKTELYRAAEKITAKTGVYALMPQIKIQHEFLEAGIDLFKKEKGEIKAAFNTEKAEAIINRYQRLVKKEVIPQDSLSSGFNIALQRYKNNKLAILFSPPQFLSEIENESQYLKDISGLAAVPAAKKGPINAALMNLVIPQGAANKKMAAKFANFISSPQAQADFSSLSAVLSSAVIPEDSKLREKSLTADFKKDQGLKKEAKKILYQQINRYQDLTLIYPEADELLKVMEEQFARAFLGKITAQQALNIMEAEWNDILQAEQTKKE